VRFSAAGTEFAGIELPGTHQFSGFDLVSDLLIFISFPYFQATHPPSPLLIASGSGRKT